MTEANTLTASVRISLKDGSVEIAGTEKFVYELLTDSQKQKLIQNMIQAMQNSIEAMADKADEDKKDSDDRIRVTMDAIKKVLEQQEQVRRATKNL